MNVLQPISRVWQNSSYAQRWQALGGRDRLALQVLGGFLLLALAYALLWQPAQRSAALAQQAFLEQRALLAYLQSRAPEVKPAQQTEAALEPARLQAVVAQSAAQLGLVLERLDVEDEGRVQVVLQPLGFAQLLSWLALLQEQGVSLNQAAIERAEKGLVMARLSLGVGA